MLATKKKRIYQFQACLIECYNSTWSLKLKESLLSERIYEWDLGSENRDDTQEKLIPTLM